MWTKFGSKLEKILKCGGPGGKGGGVVSVFGHPRPRGGGEGGQKRANFYGRSVWMAPFKVSEQLIRN